MAVDEAKIEELIDEGCVEQLVAVMKMNPQNETVTKPRRRLVDKRSQLQLMRLSSKFFTKLCMNERLAEIVGQRMGRDFGWDAIKSNHD